MRVRTLDVEPNVGLVTLATRRAVRFYLALGYEESAAHLRKVLPKPTAQ